MASRPSRVYLYNDISMLLQRGGDLDYDLVVIRDGEKVTLDQFHMEPQTFLIDGQEQRLYGMTFSRGRLPNRLSQAASARIAKSASSTPMVQ